MDRDVYEAGRRRLALADELRDRERDGWLVVDRQDFAATLVHDLPPPWHLRVVELTRGSWAESAAGHAKTALRRGS